MQKQKSLISQYGAVRVSEFSVSSLIGCSTSSQRKLADQMFFLPKKRLTSPIPKYGSLLFHSLQYPCHLFCLQFYSGFAKQHLNLTSMSCHSAAFCQVFVAPGVTLVEMHVHVSCACMCVFVCVCLNVCVLYMSKGIERNME